MTGDAAPRIPPCTCSCTCCSCRDTAQAQQLTRSRLVTHTSYTPGNYHHSAGRDSEARDRSTHASTTDHQISHRPRPRLLRVVEEEVLERLVDNHIKLGVTMIKPTTSYFLFLVTFRHNRICGLAVAFKNKFFGGLPALPKKSRNRGVLGAVGRAAPNQPKCQ